MSELISTRIKQAARTREKFPSFRATANGLTLVVATFLVAACTEKTPEPKALNTASVTEQGAIPPISLVRVTDPAQLKRGAALFQQNCAVCHGAMAQGNPDWRRVGADGKALPPPLDGTGHAWHHPTSGLRLVIKYGSPGGAGNMPAWKDKLTDPQIDDIIAWFQSLWPDAAYAAWQRTEAKAQAR
ncbi:MAG: c-type cytochrome [Sulfuriferula sp.]